MFVDLNLIGDDFLKKEGEFGGRKAILVNPKDFGVEWTQKNSIFRSSVWSEAGELLSPSFKKFVNWGERPEAFPVPENILNCSVMEKLDGSTFIVSKVDGNACARSRGTFDFAALDNGWEGQVVHEKYPNMFSNDYVTSEEYSFVFEIVSDNNRIILAYDDCPDVYLLNIIRHKDYTYLKQKEVDEIAQKLDLKRPRRYSFKDLAELLNSYSDETNIEGYCLYHSGDQHITKLKTLQYLRLHKMKSDVASVEKVIDVFIEYGCPVYMDFYAKIEDQFDYEIAEYCKGTLSKVCDAYKEVILIKDGMLAFLYRYKELNRKDLAAKIFGSYGKTSRGSMLFVLLNKGELLDKNIKKLLMQILK